MAKSGRVGHRVDTRLVDHGFAAVRRAYPQIGALHVGTAPALATAEPADHRRYPGDVPRQACQGFFKFLMGEECR